MSTPPRLRLIHGCLALAAIATMLLGAAPAAAKGAQASIVGGSPASIEEYPWVAFIQAETGGGEGFECSGSVVAPRVVLTAGHCVEDIETGQLTPAGDYAVATGVSSLAAVGPGGALRVSAAVVSPTFRPSTAHNDAGLLILATPTSAPAVRLATAADSSLLAAGTPLTVAGWGLTSADAEEISGELRAGETVVQSSAYCGRQVARFYAFYSPATQLCAIDAPTYATGTCHGDSGGPAVAQADGEAVQIGIVSLGQSKCSTALPDVFTRVDQVSSWVASWIAAVEGGTTPPEVKKPKAQLPLLTIRRAKSLASRGLGEDFRFRFRRGAGKRISCRRVEREKVKCGVSWYQGGNDYYGSITVYYLFGREAVYWDDRYVVHWVNDYCWFESGHRQSCVIHTKRR
jgi:secreted trypsin-like serine protease